MDHPVAVGANESQVLQLRRPAFRQRMDGLRVVHLYEPLTSGAIGFGEVEAASVTDQGRCARQSLLLLLIDQLAASLPCPM